MMIVNVRLQYFQKFSFHYIADCLTMKQFLGEVMENTELENAIPIPM